MSKQARSKMPLPLFSFKRTEGMSSPPTEAEVRRQFEAAQVVQDAYRAAFGKPPADQPAVIERELGMDIPSIRKMARQMGVAVRQPDWFAALIRG